jgi:hypothetical protein
MFQQHRHSEVEQHLEESKPISEAPPNAEMTKTSGDDLKADFVLINRKLQRLKQEPSRKLVRVPEQTLKVPSVQGPLEGVNKDASHPDLTATLLLDRVPSKQELSTEPNPDFSRDKAGSPVRLPSHIAPDNTERISVVNEKSESIKQTTGEKSIPRKLVDIVESNL